MEDFVIKTKAAVPPVEPVKPGDPLVPINNDPPELIPPATPPDVPDVIPEAAKVEVDGVIYTLDDKGNAIDDNKAIKYSADELKALEEVDAPSSLEEIFKLTNIVPNDENGTPIEYENSPEGIAKYVDDVYTIASNQAVEAYKNALFGTYPILMDVVKHLNNNNGSFDNFVPTVNYNDIQLDADNEEQLKNIIYTARGKRGESKEKIDKYYNYLKDSKTIFTEAEEELNYLKESLTQEEKEQQLVIKEREAKELQDAINYWGVTVDNKGNMSVANVENSVYDIIKKGKFKIGEDTYNIPDKIKINDNGKIVYATRDDFFRYIYEPVQVVINSKTQTMTRHEYDLTIENSKRDIHADVFDAFKRFVNYNTDQFIKEAINKNNVEAIKKLKTDKANRSADIAGGSKKFTVVIPNS
jgi:hypothetical protein